MIVYDAVICVGKQHNRIAVSAIRSLHYFAKPRTILIVTSIDNFAYFQDNLDRQIPFKLLNEDKIIPSIDLQAISEILNYRIGDARRAGWYFQQFLKMAVCNLPEVADYYLIWDSDTILLRSVDFFDDRGRVAIAPAAETHRPYFELTNKLLNLDKQVNFSFIAEHLMVKKEYMQLLIDRLNGSNGSSWAESILKAIDERQLPKSGFSEYETYGNFIALNFPDSFSCRQIKSTRQGTLLFGTNPDRFALFALMRAGYIYATFETWQARHIFKPKMLILAILARVLYHYCCRSGRYSDRLQAANLLGQV